MRTALHRSDGNFLADAAGDDDDRQITCHFTHQRQRILGIKSRHIVIGNHDIPDAVRQGRQKISPGINADMGGCKTVAK
jgi:hypothetical protein